MKNNLALSLLLTPLIFFGMSAQAKHQEEGTKTTEKTCMVQENGKTKCTMKEKKKHKKHDKKKHSKDKKKHDKKKHKKHDKKHDKKKKHTAKKEQK